MFKKKLHVLALCLSVLFLCSCSLEKKIATQESKNSETSLNSKAEAENQLAIAEESEVANNLTFFSASTMDLKKMLLKENTFLIDNTETASGESYIHLTNEKETLNIYLVSAADKSIYSVRYRIEEKSPLQNAELKKELLENLQTVLEGLSQNYNEQILVDAINNTKIGEISPNLEYSDDLTILLSQEEDYFTLEINAKSQ